MSETLLQVRDLSVGFPSEDGMVHAVRNLSFDLSPREVLGIVGESGSGKSVSSMAILGLLPKSAKVTGSIKYNGSELVGLSYKKMMPVRGSEISMIFQDPMTALNPVHKVGYQLAEAYLAHHKKASKKEAWAKAVDALTKVGIPQPDRRASQFPHEFSGGMRQRVVIAMAIINDPKLIIADEPTTALDVTVQAQVLEQLVEIKEATNAAILMITHDLGVIAGIADRVQVMYAGTVVESGPVEKIFATPMMPYTVGLLGSLPDPSELGEKLTPIQGTPPSLVNLPTGCTFAPRCPLASAECETGEPPLVVSDEGDHSTRCVRWEFLASLEEPKKLFLHKEIGVLVDEVVVDEEIEEILEQATTELAVPTTSTEGDEK
jgi:peptide/nickel transport system ATP-binding protein